MNPDRFRRVQDLFHAALGRAPGDRESFVREAAGGDTELEAEVLSLVTVHRDGDGLLDSALREAEAPLLDGQLVGPYRVSSEIGRGGMGVVYLAEDTRLGRRVALKALSPRLVPDRTQQERFRREAVVAASLSHPAIATIYAMEEVAGRFYIVSEYVPGEPLRNEMQAALPGPRLLSVALQLAEGLGAAHERGVVHRDLKPENVVCVADGKIKIVDFGLAIGSGPEFADARLTQSGMLLGTPAYMSPEQLRGEAVDFRSDLFSFGVLLYELAVGAHPFESDSVLGTTARILESAPDDAGKLGKSIPGLDRIVLRCLQKSPASRCASRGELVRDLRSLAEGRGRDISVGRREEPGEDALGTRWWVIHQVAVIALYALMIVLRFVANGGATRWLLVEAFLAMACGIWNGALRVHLLFTRRFNRRALARELGRSLFLVRPVDLVFSSSLLAGALTILPESQPWAAVFGAVGICYAAVAFIVEPATLRSVFPDRE
jgi:hypothetical protein